MKLPQMRLFRHSGAGFVGAVQYHLAEDRSGLWEREWQLLERHIDGDERCSLPAGPSIAHSRPIVQQAVVFRIIWRNVQFTSTVIGAVPLAGSELIRKRLPSAKTAY